MSAFKTTGRPFRRKRKRRARRRFAPRPPAEDARSLIALFSPGEAELMVLQGHARAIFPGSSAAERMRRARWVKARPRSGALAAWEAACRDGAARSTLERLEQAERLRRLPEPERASTRCREKRRSRAARRWCAPRTTRGGIPSRSRYVLAPHTPVHVPQTSPDVRRVPRRGPEADRSAASGGGEDPSRVVSRTAEGRVAISWRDSRRTVVPWRARGGRLRWLPAWWEAPKLEDRLGRRLGPWELRRAELAKAANAEARGAAVEAAGEFERRGRCRRRWGDEVWELDPEIRAALEKRDGWTGPRWAETGKPIVPRVEYGPCVSGGVYEERYGKPDPRGVLRRIVGRGRG